MKSQSRTIGLIEACAALFLSVSAASAMSLREAVNIALVSNPQVGEAIQNREAIEFELQQARGLYLPRVDVEASAGVENYENPNQSLAGQFGNLRGTFWPLDSSLVVTQKIFDGFGTDAQIERQAARVDSGSFRVWERSENIALAIAREYIQAQLQLQVLRIAQENLAFHRRTLGDIEEATKSGALTDADKFQAQERVTAAITKVKQAEEALSAARIRFFELVAKPLSAMAPLSPVAGYVPRTLDQAIGAARTNNPTVAIAWADADAADALVKQAQAKYLPEVFAEGRARAGHDIDLTPGRTTDLQARLVVRWNIYDGGIKSASEQEQIRRASEQRLKVEEEMRAIDQQVRLAWDTRAREGEIGRILARQLDEDANVVSSYQDQFKVGRRSLLDVLDAQNTRFNVAVLRETANYAALFADYQLLASTGSLLKALNIAPPAAAQTYARAHYGVALEGAKETQHRYSPDRPANP
jgi:adhesin transport system outer membrane protein